MTAIDHPHHLVLLEWVGHPTGGDYSQHQTQLHSPTECQVPDEAIVRHKEKVGWAGGTGRGVTIKHLATLSQTFLSNLFDLLYIAMY